jgi:hypothetical protein
MRCAPGCAARARSRPPPAWNVIGRSLSRSTTFQPYADIGIIRVMPRRRSVAVRDVRVRIESLGCIGIGVVDAPSEAAFAALAGVAPIPASFGQVHRHRLNRSVDRQLNCALHTIILARLRTHQETLEYAHRRTLEGKSPREIKRCLKRHLARRCSSSLKLSPRTQRSIPLAPHEARESAPLRYKRTVECP